MGSYALLFIFLGGVLAPIEVTSQDAVPSGEEYPNMVGTWVDPGNITEDVSVYDAGAEPDKGRGVVEAILGFPGKFLAKVGISIGKIGAKIAKRVQDRIEKNESKQGFFSGLTQEIFYDLDAQCNIIIFNGGKPHINRLRGVLYSTQIPYKNEVWTLQVIKDGEFTNANLDPTSWPTMSVAGDYWKPATWRVGVIPVKTWGRMISFNNHDSCYPND